MTKLNFTNNKVGYLSEDEYATRLIRYANGELEPTTKEKLVINPKVAYEVDSKMITDSVPENVKKYKDMYGDVNHFSKTSPVANLNWDYLYFVDMDYFRPAAIKFQKSIRNGGKRKASYCTYPKGTTAYKKYWKAEFQRCVDGYEPFIDDKPCGLKISGEFYFYLNYARILLMRELEDGTAFAEENFPDFLSMDYYYFKELDARSNPSKYGLPADYKKPMVLTKSRRKGFSFKAAASSAWVIAFHNRSKVAIASAPDTLQTDAALAAKKAIPTLDQLSNYTPFGRQEVGDVKKNGGWKNEVSSITKLSVNVTLGIFNTRTREKRGRQSSLTTITLSKDDAASGEGLTRLYFEEAGKISNLNKAWGFAKESMKAGSLYRGLAIIFGCFTGDTTVFNNHGEAIRIDALNPDKGIIGFSSKNLMPQTIIAVKQPFKKECVNVKTQYGTITCSVDHPMLVSYNDNSKKPYHKDETELEDRAYIRNNRTLSCWYERADKLTKDHVLLIPNLITAASNVMFGSKVLSRNIDHDSNSKLIRIIDHLKINGTLPKEAWDLNEKSTWTLVSALFDLFGDGKVYRTDPEHKGTLMIYRLFVSKISGSELLKETSKSIKMLLYKVGVLAYTKGDDQTINSACKGNFKEYYEELSDNDLYISNPHEVLSHFIKNTRFQEQALRKVSKDYTPNMMATSLSRNVNTIENSLLPREYMFPQSLYFNKETTVKPNDMFGDHIKNVYGFKVIGSPKKLKEKQTVYNLTCSPNHNYLANGYVAGNTGGEMVSDTGDSGRSKAFAVLFNNPIVNDLAAFDNIYDYQPSNMKCGFFVSDMWANFGARIKINGEVFEAMDKRGNAFFWVAEMALNRERLIKRPPNGTQADYNLFLTQRCKTPSEAFFATKGSIFNTADLMGVQGRIESTTYGFSKYYTVGTLEETKEGRITFIPDLEDKLNPITSLNYDNNNKEGALVVYERPKKIKGEIPKDAYIISCDPIGQDTSTGNSLVSIIVMKTPVHSVHEGFGYERVVATYIGRKQYSPMTYARELLLRLSKFYNAKVTYENDRDGGILQFFTSKNELNRLLPSPELVMSKHLPNSSTRLRKFGHSMATLHHKVLGETLLNEWLDYRHPTIKGLNYKDEYVEKVGPRNMDLLQDQMILEQLISYNRTGNYDAVMTLMGAVIQMKELYDVNLLENQERSQKTASSVKRWMKKVLREEDQFGPSDFRYI